LRLRLRHPLRLERARLPPETRDLSALERRTGRSRLARLPAPARERGLHARPRREPRAARAPDAALRITARLRAPRRLDLPRAPRRTRGRRLPPVRHRLRRRPPADPAASRRSRTRPARPRLGPAD